MYGNRTKWIVLSSTPIVRQFYVQKLKYEGKIVFFQNYFHLCLMIAHGKCAEIIYSVLVIQLIGKIWWFMLAQSLPPFVQYLVFVLHMIFWWYSISMYQFFNQIVHAREEDIRYKSILVWWLMYIPKVIFEIDK